MKKSAGFSAVIFVLFYFCLGCSPSIEKTTAPVELIVRGDDMGMTHTCNLAVKKNFQEGILTCASIIVPSPWFEEAARMCREHPEWCIGVHLTLNSEWRDYRWKPVVPYSEVPSLVDEDGYFYPTTEAFLEASPELEDVERELRAQMELALKRGIDVQYIDTHMDTARSTPELREIVLSICQDYDLPLGVWKLRHRVVQPVQFLIANDPSLRLVRIRHRRLCLVEGHGLPSLTRPVAVAHAINNARRQIAFEIAAQLQFGGRLCESDKDIVHNVLSHACPVQEPVCYPEQVTFVLLIDARQGGLVARLEFPDKQLVFYHIRLTRPAWNDRSSVIIQSGVRF